MKIFFLFVTILYSVALNAQVTKVKLKAGGLTCSMCSNAINKALKTLDFVDGVHADIKSYTFEITFKANSMVDFDKIRCKVEGAGFFVVGFSAFIHFNNAELSPDGQVAVGDKYLLFLNPEERMLRGMKEVRILNKGFVSQKEFKQLKRPCPLSGTYYATI